MCLHYGFLRFDPLSCLLLALRGGCASKCPCSSKEHKCCKIWPLLSYFLSTQEIALLSQFEHENIVQYYDTDKVSKFTLSFCWYDLVYCMHRNSLFSFLSPLCMLRLLCWWPSNCVTVFQEGSKLYIFLELVTQGSLASLYQKYRLLDTHASAYTRQILNGLTYLHERNIVHR